MPSLAAILLLALSRAEIIARFKAPVITQAEGLVRVFADCPEDMRREYQMPVASFAAETVKSLRRGLSMRSERSATPGIVIYVGEVRTNVSAVVARAVTNGASVVSRIYIPAPGYADVERLRLEIVKGFYRRVCGKELSDEQAVAAYRASDPDLRLEDMRSGFSGDVDPEGHFLHVSEPRREHPAENLNREYKLTPHTHDALYRLREKWLPLLQSLSEEDNAYLADPNNTYLVPVRDLMLQELVLPDETFLSREEAESAAIRAIEAVDGWKKELTAHIGLDLDVTHIPAGSGRPVWDLVYDLAGDAEFHRLFRSGAAVSDREFDRLDRQSDQDRDAFGGSAPLYIFVRIDARTGELIGDVHFEMAPSDRRMEELLILP